MPRKSDRRQRLATGCHREHGDIDGFDFQWGVRLYGVGDYSYQNIKKAERQKMTIGGEEVVEIDINASFLTISHRIPCFSIHDSPIVRRFD